MLSGTGIDTQTKKSGGRKRSVRQKPPPKKRNGSTSDVWFPQSVKQFNDGWPAFKRWLQAKGSEVLAPANPYEVARFTVPGGTGVVYRNVNDVITPSHWQGGSASAWIAYRRKLNDWRVGEKTHKLWTHEKAGLLEAIVRRDGWRCVYCPTRLTPETATLEHFVPVTHQGPNHISNMALACEPCNTAVGHKSVAEKMRFRDENFARARRKYDAARGSAWVPRCAPEPTRFLKLIARVRGWLPW